MDELIAVDRTKFWIDIQMKSSEDSRAIVVRGKGVVGEGDLAGERQWH